MQNGRPAVLVCFFLFTGFALADGADSATVTLTPDLSSGQPVGTRVTWSVSTTEPTGAAYRLASARLGEPLRVMYDSGPQNVFEWASIDEGLHVLVASVRHESGAIGYALQGFLVTRRAIGQPVITPTEHPLVALYSAPPCTAGTNMRVLYTPAISPRLSATPAEPCRAGRSMNFYVAGMRPSELYVMVHELLDADGTPVGYGPARYHVSGPLPATGFPVNNPVDLPDAGTSLLERVVLLSHIIGTDELDPFPFATDLWGNVIWYYDRQVAPEPDLYRSVAGGTFLIAEMDEQLLREVDLVGNVVRQTSAPRITEQLVQMGHDALGAFHHEALRLESGQTAVLGSVERLLENVQGPGQVNVLGDYIVVLDENWQVAWAWNSFDHLDVTRLAVLGETCMSLGPGCPILFLGEPANDWTHGNAIEYSPSDGNLLLSLRHQDWVIKIDYHDGAGSGNVLWRMGPAGDFVFQSADPNLWFTHQHDPRYVTDSRLVIYDNGNTRCEENANLCQSRGQVIEVDEQNMTATMILNADLGQYSFALGSAQGLLNGNFHFGSGLMPDGSERFSTADEVAPDGAKVYSLRTESPVYRSYRLVDLYTPPLQGLWP